MELSFATENLRAICESRRRARARLGSEASQSLEMALADLQACQSLSELETIYGKLPLVEEDESWELVVDNLLAVRFVSGHIRTPRRKSGSIDRNKVTRIKIEKIRTL